MVTEGQFIVLGFLMLTLWVAFRQDGINIAEWRKMNEEGEGDE